MKSPSHLPPKKYIYKSCWILVFSLYKIYCVAFISAFNMEVGEEVRIYMQSFFLPPSLSPPGGGETEFSHFTLQSTHWPFQEKLREIPLPLNFNQNAVGHYSSFSLGRGREGRGEREKKHQQLSRKLNFGSRGGAPPSSSFARNFWLSPEEFLLFLFPHFKSQKRTIHPSS